MRHFLMKNPFCNGSRERFFTLAERALTGCMKLTEISRVPCVRSKMSSLPSADALFVSRKRRSYQVSFSREEADSERSFALRNDLSRCPFCPEKKPLSSALFSGEGCSLRGPFELRNALPRGDRWSKRYKNLMTTVLMEYQEYQRSPNN